jgi:hypothetical protein
MTQAGISKAEPGALNGIGNAAAILTLIRLPAWSSSSARDSSKSPGTRTARPAALVLIWIQVQDVRAE